MFTVMIRVDASLEIGIGHVMRCLTLANNLKHRGILCHFVCRNFPNNEGKRIQEAGHGLTLLPVEAPDTWLGASLHNDGIQTAKILFDLQPAWLIVDHYRISGCWFLPQRDANPNLRILAIDDLADRALDCDVLVDPTHGRRHADYHRITPPECKLLLGADYAMLRPEFSILRLTTLARRKLGKPETPHILIGLGGGDTHKTEEIIYSALINLRKIANFTATMIVGNAKVSKALTRHSINGFKVKAYSKNIANEMANADIAIGAAGGMSWERCCLGLPSIILTLAENQKVIADTLGKAQAAISIRPDQNTLELVLARLINNPQYWLRLSENASMLCDGDGVNRITKLLEDQSNVRTI